MVTIGVINWVIAVFIFFRSFKWAQQEPHHSKYFLLLRTLGIIFVSVALYRSVFVSSYPDRLVWFDTILNSPFLIRCLAFFAELSFIGIIAVILLKLNSEIPLDNYGKNQTWINALLTNTPFIAVGCIFIAQFFAFAGLFTQYHSLFAIEEMLWLTAFLSIAPLIFVRLKQVKNQKLTEKSYKIFLIIMTIWCIGYLVFQCFSLPFVYFAHLSQDVGRVIPPDPLRQAIYTYTVTRDFQTWGGLGFFIWHSSYFSICVWMVLFFMSSPRKRILSKTAETG